MIRNYLKKNDIDGMRNELVLRNVGLIRTYSKQWNTLYTRDECASFGIEGLMTAAKTFDPKVGVRFATYASYAIRSCLRRRKETIMNDIDKRSISLDMTYVNQDHKDSSFTDIVDSKVRDEYRVVKPTRCHIGKGDTVSFVMRLIRDIGCSEREIRMFYQVVVCGKTMEEVGQSEGVSRERVRQIISRVCGKLRKNIGKVSDKLTHRVTPNMEDFTTTKTYSTLRNGRVVSVTQKTGIKWNEYYDSIRQSNYNCMKALKEIIRDGISL